MTSLVCRCVVPLYLWFTLNYRDAKSYGRRLFFIALSTCRWKKRPRLQQQSSRCFEGSPLFVWQHTCSFLEVRDIARLAQTCKFLGSANLYIGLKSWRVESRVKIESITQLLNKARNLEYVDLTGFRITNDVVLSMASEWRRLKMLRIRSQGLTSTSLRELLSRCTELSAVQIDNAHMFPEEVAALKQDFKHVKIDILHRFSKIDIIEAEVADLVAQVQKRAKRF
eukprot:TRINITY_DN9627_c0_g2_i1.p1 TRINITY_DN9627_c0_g2~~TRINITY_DN9627_c0_g2_i1.p1  ORF type:complete len:225 (+),score=30.17 TRINITY_DN9627_c0_g2_i1:138-812(+)